MTELASDEPVGQSAAAVAPTPKQSAGKPRSSPVAVAASIAGRYNLVVLLLISIAVYAFWDKTSATFFTAPNFRNIVGSQVVLALLTLGLLLPLVAGQIDLSVGSVAGLSTILTAAAFANYNLPLWAGVLVGVAAGALVGLVNGFIVTRLRVDPFITTLGTASVVVGVVEWYTNGLSIVEGVPRALITFGSGNWFGIPSVIYALAAASLAIYYLIDHTPFGRSLNSIGVNRDAARLVGIKVERVILLAFIGSGVAAGIAGVMLTARSGAGNPQVGPFLTLAAIASAFLGATSFRPGRVNVMGALVAILFLNVNITGLSLAGVPNFINDLFTGVALVLAVALATTLGRRRRAVAHAQETKAAAAEPT